MTVVDTGVGYTVQEIDASTLRVVVTMPDIVPTPSTVASQPPPTHQISYRFKLFVDVNGIEATAEKDSDPRHALWRMPDSFARYSPVSGGRDAGGDDWSSRGAYNWLEQYRAQITSINDISGEHARNISHATHARGTDIDMYHFYTFPSATTGSSNYVLLRADVLLAPGITSTDPIIKANAEAARGRVIAWVTATRNGINGLAASSQVAELLHILGAAGSGLTNGWGRDLLQTGQTTVNGQALNLGLGTWSNAKYVPRWDHNDHVHITLDRAALGE